MLVFNMSFQAGGMDKLETEPTLCLSSRICTNTVLSTNPNLPFVSLVNILPFIITIAIIILLIIHAHHHGGPHLLGPLVIHGHALPLLHYWLYWSIHHLWF